MNVRAIAAVLAAFGLGAGVAVGCASGQDESKGNQGVQTPQGGKTSIQTGPTTLESSGTQPSVTQGAGGSGG